MNHKFITSLFLFSVVVFCSSTLFAGKVIAHPANSPLTLCATPDDSVAAPVVADDIPENTQKPAPPTTRASNHNNLPGFPDVDTFPEYKGGQSALMRDISTLLRYPKYAKEHGIEGRVVLQFFIDENGNLDKRAIKVLRSAGPELDNEAIWVIKHLRQFRPAKRNGQPVKSYFVLPIIFSLSN